MNQGVSGGLVLSRVGKGTMTVGLIPQDELTIDLLAKVLAKMYRFSRNNGADEPPEAAAPSPRTAGANALGRLADRRETAHWTSGSARST